MVLHPSFSSSFGRTLGNSDPIYPDLLTPVRHLLMECVNVFALPLCARQKLNGSTKHESKVEIKD